MQAARILLGCVAAWVAGSVCMTVAALALGAHAASGAKGVPATFSTWLFFGLLPALPLTGLVMIAWAILAYRKRTVSWWQAPLFSFCVGLVLFAGSFQSRIAFAWLLLSAVVVALSFWGAAFGRQGRVQLSLGKPGPES